MKNSNSKIILFGITILLFVSLGFIISEKRLYTDEKIENQENFLNLSTNEITIITPENRTYITDENENLLISYETDILLESAVYSLDSQPNIAISGNATIPMPENGIHTIQIFGNDSFGIEYESEIRYFSVGTKIPYIEILSPEEKIYTEIEPTGIYPATFGFENEADGTSGTQISYVDDTNPISAGCEIKIYGEYQEHKKVLRVKDGNTNGNARATHYFDSSQTTGTIEWWWLNPSVTNSRMWVNFHEGLFTTRAFHLRAIDGMFYANDATSVLSYNADQWYHHKVTFNTFSDTYDWYIDNVLVVDDGVFSNDVSNIGCTIIKGGWNSIGESFFDAFGHSWDPYYNIGDNINEEEGFILRYSTNTNFDWMAYSLDSQPNIVISGIVLIPIPEDGLHTIQIFAKDSLGINYESAIKYFAIDTSLEMRHIEIVSPEEKIYKKPTGLYHASFGFENEADGTSGTQISYVDDTNPISAGCEIKIYGEYQEHKKVLRVKDGNTNGNARATHYFDSSQTTGTIEWWWLNPSVTNSRMWVNFHEGLFTTRAFHLRAIDGMFYANDATSVLSYNADQWYHHKVTFNTFSDTYDWYIDNVLVVDDGVFSNDVSNIGCTIIKGGWNSIGESFFDAFGHSWDPYYNIGDNFNDGLVIKYLTSKIFDWVAYSLDSQPNIAISGDTIIPIPEDGLHTIQIFAKDSLGINYESEVRYFCVTASELFECLFKIQELKMGSITHEALNYLNQAENKLYLAIEKVTKDLIAPSLYLLMDVIHFLLDAEGEGVYVLDIISLIMEYSDGVVYQKIVETEDILSGESNNHLEKAWSYYNKALNLWNDGYYENAMSYFAKAYEKTQDALLM
ncbi:MAG: hypothetical protein ACFFG0_17730 [Candidatus Thorarchaeota archaeon]